jgi:hypothetical protein
MPDAGSRSQKHPAIEIPRATCPAKLRSRIRGNSDELISSRAAFSKRDPPGIRPLIQYTADSIQ